MRNYRVLALVPFVCAAIAVADEPLKPRSCGANASFKYLQRGNEAQVDYKIENTDCAVSSGEFRVELTIREDGTDLPTRLSFSESWQRDSDAPFELSKLYPIGDNVDLLRVKIRKLTCYCEE
jgi:hypothetical protein